MLQTVALHKHPPLAHAAAPSRDAGAAASLGPASAAMLTDRGFPSKVRPFSCRCLALDSAALHASVALNASVQVRPAAGEKEPRGSSAARAMTANKRTPLLLHASFRVPH